MLSLIQQLMLTVTAFVTFATKMDKENNAI